MKHYKIANATQNVALHNCQKAELELQLWCLFPLLSAWVTGINCFNKLNSPWTRGWLFFINNHPEDSAWHTCLSRLFEPLQPSELQLWKSKFWQIHTGHTNWTGFPACGSPGLGPVQVQAPMFQYSAPFEPSSSSLLYIFLWILFCASMDINAFLLQSEPAEGDNLAGNFSLLLD